MMTATFMAAFIIITTTSSNMSTSSMSTCAPPSCQVSSSSAPSHWQQASPSASPTSRGALSRATSASPRTGCSPIYRQVLPCWTPRQLPTSRFVLPRPVPPNWAPPNTVYTCIGGGVQRGPSRARATRPAELGTGPEGPWRPPPLYTPQYELAVGQFGGTGRGIQWPARWARESADGAGWCRPPAPPIQ